MEKEESGGKGSEDKGSGGKDGEKEQKGMEGEKQRTKEGKGSGKEMGMGILLTMKSFIHH